MTEFVVGDRELIPWGVNASRGVLKLIATSQGVKQLLVSRDYRNLPEKVEWMWVRKGRAYGGKPAQPHINVERCRLSRV